MNIATTIAKLFTPLTEVESLQHKLEQMEWERDVFRDAMLRDQVSEAAKQIKKLERK